VLSDSIWITGATRSGKTTRLVQQFCQWTQGLPGYRASTIAKSQTRNELSRHTSSRHLPKVPGILVLGANGENRMLLSEKIATQTEGRYGFESTTILGFFEREVILFWPLLIKSLDLKAQFPLRLRSETEQELAMKLWSPDIEGRLNLWPGVSLDRMVRRILDLFQLAAWAAVPTEEIPGILEAGWLQETEVVPPWLEIGKLLGKWREWCLRSGFLTLGLIGELYWRYLLADRVYQKHLGQRYQAIFADDVDEYGAIARHLFDFLLDKGVVGTFTYNPEGGIRVGLGADPNYLGELQYRCQVETLHRASGLTETLAKPFLELVQTSFLYSPPTPEKLPDNTLSLLGWGYRLPPCVDNIQTVSRVQMLEETVKKIAIALKSQEVEPQDIAIIAPGLDEISRYTLIELLNDQHIPVEALNEQQPLVSYPIVRSLLTLLALVYPGLGRLVDRDTIAELLIVLSRQRTNVKLSQNSQTPTDGQYYEIDAVRAGLLADYCYYPDPETPHLLPVTTFRRWDRLGYRATIAYNEIVQWIEETRSRYQQNQLGSPLAVLERAIQHFILVGKPLPYHQLSALRELRETAMHYWEIDGQLQQIERENYSSTITVSQFIQLLRRGIISANPYPIKTDHSSSEAVTLATIFQYRSSRRDHKWHFWIDVGSQVWMNGGSAVLYGAPLFLQERLRQPWTEQDTIEADEQRLKRILNDLLSRVRDRLYLCHSQLWVNGQEQSGPLLPLIWATEIPKTP
jgi:hypothetical protein